MFLTMRTTSRTATVLLALATLLIPSCRRFVDDARAVAGPERAAMAGSDASQCQAVDAPLTTIEAHGDDEPVMKIPQPKGWNRSTKLDSELFRFSMGNRSLVKDGFASNVVVTLESVPGIEDPEVVFDSMRQALESGFGATDVGVSDQTLCGLPAQMVHYLTPPIGNIAPHPGNVIIAVLRTDHTTYAASVTIQTADPDNPTYQRDADMILNGFQMLPPTPN